jgi:hypothetical protein
MLAVEAAVIAYLAWIAVRGTTDVRRPQIARYLASGALVIGAAFAAVGVVVGAAVIVQVVFALSNGPLGGDGGLFWIGTWPVMAALLVAFALGLADNSVRVSAAGGGAPTPSEPVPDPVRWPDPGGEVPTFRPLAPPPSDLPGQARAKKSRRRKAKGS